MLGSLFDLLKNPSSPLEPAQRDCLEMLRTTREMYRISGHVMKDRGDQAALERLTYWDETVNRLHSEALRKIYAHLAVASSRDVSGAVRLLTAVQHVERVGDYTKNIGEICRMTPLQAELGPHWDVALAVHGEVAKVFDLTYQALTASDAEAGRQAVEQHRSVSRTCQRTIETLLRESGDTGAPTATPVVALMLRYLKRLSSHLKNAARAVESPIHKLG